MNRHRQLNILGWCLLVLCALWWAFSLHLNHLLFGHRVWFSVWPFLGVDFLHNYRAVHILLQGASPYGVDLGNQQGHYAYPPLVLVLFIWCGWMKPQLATILWIAFIAVVLAATAWITARHGATAAGIARGAEYAAALGYAAGIMRELAAAAEARLTGGAR